ncbi:MAG TPA: DUF3106 domain-containing protein [Candidatus Binatia bacterium]|nr:DUF3106 domain-containing protein [Candidatus Binatia bacterium]
MVKRIASTLVLGSFLLLAADSAWSANDDWRNLTPREKDRIQRNYQRWQDLPPRDKEHLREEWNRFQNLPKDRRDRLKQRFDEQRRDRDHNRDRD